MTVQEKEEYSAEEEENAENVKEKVSTVKKAKVVDEVAKPKEKTPKKKPAKQTSAKQGTIMSFFNKK